MRIIPVAELHALFKAQGVSGQQHCAVVCPMCGTVQSGASLMKAGAGKTFEEVERFIGWSCVGRWTGAPGPRKKPDGEPCDWTLGGLFKVHRTEVVTPDGKHHPYFEIATPEQARELEATAASDTTMSR